MNNEHSPEASPGNRYQLPEYLNERNELIHSVGNLVESWAIRDEVEGSALLQGPSMAQLIIQDCRFVDDMNEELLNRNLPDSLQLSWRRSWHERRIHTYAPVSELANSVKLDAAPILNEHFADSIHEYEATISARSNPKEAFEAAQYLRRLFQAREQMGVLNGFAKFDTTYFDAVLYELMQEE